MIFIKKFIKMSLGDLTNRFIFPKVFVKLVDLIGMSGFVGNLVFLRLFYVFHFAMRFVSFDVLLLLVVLLTF